MHRLELSDSCQLQILCRSKVSPHKVESDVSANIQEQSSRRYQAVEDENYDGVTEYERIGFG